MHNTDLTALGSLIAAGADPAERLAPLHAHINRQSIQAGSLTFDGASSSTSVNRAIVIADTWVLRAQLANVLPMLSGCGPNYSGMFDACAADLPEATLQAIQAHDAPVASVGRQVAVCLRVLAMPYGSLSESLGRVVQQHLSSLLLLHPVLLHPGLLVPVEVAGKTSYTGVALALCQSRHGGLPRYSHFHPNSQPSDPAGLDDQRLVAKLKAFAAHPCVSYGLSTKGLRLDGGDTSGMTCVVEAKPESLHSAMVRGSWPRAQFFASLMELSDLGSPSFPRWSTFFAQDRFAGQIVPLLASSAMAAAGTLHSAMAAGVRGWTPAYQRDPWFLKAVAADMPGLASAGNLATPFGRAMATGLQRRLFVAGGQNLPARLVQQNTVAVVRGMIEMGLFPTARQASQFLIAQVIGADRPDGQLPRVSSTMALGFLSGLDELSQLGANLNGTDLAEIGQLRRLITDTSAKRSANRDDWLTALDAISAERRMLAILKAPVQLTLDTIVPATAAAPLAPARLIA